MLLLIILLLLLLLLLLVLLLLLLVLLLLLLLLLGLRSVPPRVLHLRGVPRADPGRLRSGARRGDDAVGNTHRAQISQFE